MAILNQGRKSRCPKQEKQRNEQSDLFNLLMGGSFTCSVCGSKHKSSFSSRSDKCRLELHKKLNHLEYYNNPTSVLTVSSILNSSIEKIVHGNLLAEISIKSPYNFFLGEKFNIFVAMYGLSKDYDYFFTKDLKYCGVAQKDFFVLLICNPEEIISRTFQIILNKHPQFIDHINKYINFYDNIFLPAIQKPPELSPVFEDDIGSLALKNIYHDDNSKCAEVVTPNKLFNINWSRGKIFKTEGFYDSKNNIVYAFVRDKENSRATLFRLDLRGDFVPINYLYNMEIGDAIEYSQDKWLRIKEYDMSPLGPLTKDNIMTHKLFDYYK